MTISNHMKKIFLIVITFTGLYSCGQNLTCADFKNGKFLVPADSIIPKSYIIERNDGMQTELDENGNKSFVNIKYLDDCNYILTYDEQLNELDETAKLINDSGGMQVKVIEIVGDTLIYNGLLVNDTLRFEQPGRIIKIN